MKKKWLLIFTMLVFVLSCKENKDLKFNNTFDSFEYWQLDLNKRDSVFIKYLKKDDALLYKVRYNGADITKVKKLYRDGRIEKWEHYTSNGKMFGDYYMYSSDGRMLLYRYINPDTSVKNSNFGYDFDEGNSVIKGRLLVNHFDHGDSIKLLFPKIYFAKYKVMIREVDSESEEILYQQEIKGINNEYSYMYKQFHSGANLSIDISAEGLIQDSVITQNYKILGSVSKEDIDKK